MSRKKQTLLNSRIAGISMIKHYYCSRMSLQNGRCWNHLLLKAQALVQGLAIQIPTKIISNASTIWRTQCTLSSWFLSEISSVRLIFCTDTLMHTFPIRFQYGHIWDIYEWRVYKWNIIPKIWMIPLRIWKYTWFWWNVVYYSIGSPLKVVNLHQSCRIKLQ